MPLDVIPEQLLLFGFAMPARMTLQPSARLILTGQNPGYRTISLFRKQEEKNLKTGKNEDTGRGGEAEASGDASLLQKYVTMGTVTQEPSPIRLNAKGGPCISQSPPVCFFGYRVSPVFSAILQLTDAGQSGNNDL